ncbi:MAG: proline dehydrogenase [Calditrichaeota bacterium]|nr:proline dehydrogenase [Calditrichota bacterium]
MGIFNKLVALSLPFFPKPIVGFFSRPYIAGEHLSDAVRVVKSLMAEGACATIDVLGEEVTDKSRALAALDNYITVLNTIEEEKLDANISIKLTQLGLKIDKEFCFQNVRRLVEEARKHRNFVRIDMEDSSCTSDTLEIYRRLRREFDNVGTVLQAYLRRTIQDINDLLPLKPNLRICKGIYVEPREIAYKDKFIINRNFTYALEKLLSHGCYVGIATHDEKLVWEALRIIDQLKLDRNRFEFQMLLGVDPQLRRIIIRSGYKLRVYVPFGTEWFAYSTRRLKENPRIVGYIMQNLIDQTLGRKQ